MADKIEDGGPAFPTINGYVDSFGSVKQKSEGLSLRDYFAGKAMSWALSKDYGNDWGHSGKQHAPRAAANAYAIADAMLKARKEGV
jgi:hypothetical protein